MKCIILIFFLACIAMAFTEPAIAAKRYGHHLCQQSELYICYKVKRNDTWKKLFPDPTQRDLVRRLNRKNIRLSRGAIIAIPNNLVALDYYSIAPFHLETALKGERVIIFDPKKLAWAAYDENGQLLRWGPASGGNTWCSDVKRSCRTARGEFYIYRKRGGYCKSAKYPLGKGGAPMPYCMYFYRGFAFHGSPVVPGYNASHGCVRLFTEDAKWLNEEFIGKISKDDRVKVIVLPYGKMQIER